MTKCSLNVNVKKEIICYSNNNKYFSEILYIFSYQVHFRYFKDVLIFTTQQYKNIVYAAFVVNLQGNL